MEKLADAVENLLEKKLFLYQELEHILEQEKNHAVDMDVDSLWITIAKKKKVISNLVPLHRKMLKLLEKRATDLSMDKTSFKLPDLIKKLPVSKQIKSKLSRTGSRLDIIKKSVSALAFSNKKYINESMIVLNDVFSMVVNSANKKQYTRSGNLLETNEKSRLFNAEV